MSNSPGWALVGWVRRQVRDGMGLDAPAGLIGFCVTTFAFILVAERGLIVSCAKISAWMAPTNMSNSFYSAGYVHAAPQEDRTPA